VKAVIWERQFQVFICRRLWSGLFTLALSWFACSALVLAFNVSLVSVAYRLQD